MTLQETQSTDIIGSLRAVAKQRNISVGEVLAGIEVVLLFDTSTSMAGFRINEANKALQKLQQQFPGKICLVCFNDLPSFHADGRPGAANGCTALDRALLYVKPFDGTGVHFIVISDGEPDRMSQTLDIADTFTDKISGILITDEEGSRLTQAMVFMHKLSRNGGTDGGIVSVLKLEEAVLKLLNPKT